MNASRDLPKLVAAIAVGVFALLPMAKLPAFYDSFLYLVFFWVSLSTSWALTVSAPAPMAPNGWR